MDQDISKALERVDDPMVRALLHELRRFRRGERIDETVFEAQPDRDPLEVAKEVVAFYGPSPVPPRHDFARELRCLRAIRAITNIRNLQTCRELWLQAGGQKK